MAGSRVSTSSETWKGLVIDHLDRDEFRNRRGYDPFPFLPVFAGRHYAVCSELSKRHGLEIHPESAGPHGAPVDSLRTLGIGAYPQMEYWANSPTHRVKDSGRFFVKETAAARTASTSASRWCAPARRISVPSMSKTTSAGAGTGAAFAMLPSHDSVGQTPYLETVRLSRVDRIFSRVLDL